jgi:uncharacterized coiled-coil protein SlyX
VSENRKIEATEQEAIIRDQQREIDSLNAKLIEKVAESVCLREQLAALEDRLLHPNAPMSRSTGFRCPICCARKGEMHTATCTESGMA